MQDQIAELPVECHLPLRVEIAAVVNLRIIVLLHLSRVLVELLVIEIRLNLIHNLLGSRPSAVLCLSQLLHRCCIDSVPVTMPDPVRQVVVH